MGLLHGQAAGSNAARMQQDQAAVLRAWLRAALDGHCRAPFADLSQALAACGAFGFLPWGDIDLVSCSGLA